MKLFYTVLCWLISHAFIMHVLALFLQGRLRIKIHFIFLNVFHKLYHKRGKKNMPCKWVSVKICHLEILSKILTRKTWNTFSVSLHFTLFLTWNKLLKPRNNQNSLDNDQNPENVKYLHKIQTGFLFHTFFWQTQLEHKIFSWPYFWS